VPRFSVIIPAFNAERTIGETIGSVAAQTERDLELVVVDDGSSDATPEVVERAAAADARIRLVRQPNAGTAGARNTGITRSTADRVCFLDNDDLWMPTYLAAMGAALDAEPAAGFAYCDAWSLDDATLRLRRRTELESRPPPAPGVAWEQLALALLRENFVMSSTMVRRSALAEAGGFRTDVLGVDDYDLWLRIVLAGHTAVRGGSAPLLLQRDRHDSQSKDDPAMTEGLRLTLERARSNPALPPAGVAIVEARLGEIARRRGPDPVGSLRRWAVELRDRLTGDRQFMDRVPPAVAAAFPQVRGRSDA